MVSSFEDDIFVLRQRPIHVDREAIEGAKRRHRAQLTIRKEILELLLCRESNVVGHEDVPETVEINVPTGWEDGHHEPVVRFDDHYLCDLLHWCLEEFGEYHCAIGLAVGQDVVTHMFTVEIFLQRPRDGHDCTS